jgi:hypothetical protein
MVLLHSSNVQPIFPELITCHVQSGCISPEIQNRMSFIDRYNCARYVLPITRCKSIDLILRSDWDLEDDNGAD